MNGDQNPQNCSKSCPHCEGEIPAHSPNSLCPSCMFKAGILDDKEADHTSETKTSPASQHTPEANDGGSTEMKNVLKYVGDYELIEEIARGGMGVVYRAKQMSLNRIVAIKMILSGALADEKDIQRFHREAEAAAHLDHPGIVPIYEVGEHENQSYYSMKYVQGSNLSDFTAKQSWTIRESALLLQKVVDALAYAHQNGVIHRDLKPANILIDSELEPRITDFGLAKQNHSQNALTLSGQILGTPSYMPPEQALGKPGELDERSDIYSLGAILYEMLTGRPPFHEESPLNTLNQVINKVPTAPHRVNVDVPVDLSSICMKCLEKQKFDRYPSASALSKDLGNYLEGKATEARPLTSLETARRYVVKRRFGFTVMAVSLGALLFAAFLSTWIYGAIARNRESKLCNLWLATKDSGLVGEIISKESDRVIVKKFEIPNREAIVLPHNEYRLRLSAPNRLSETIRFQIDSTDQRRYTDRPEFFHTVGLDNRSLRSQEAESTQVITIATKPQLIIPKPTSHRVPNLFLESSATLPDLNRDGKGDAVFLDETQIYAVNGGTNEKAWSHPIENPNRLASCVLVEHDLSIEPNILAYAVKAIGSHQDQLTAISAVDGTELWSFKLDSLFKNIPKPTGISIGNSESRVKLARAGSPNDPMIACKFGRYLFVVEALTGKPRWKPIDLRMTPTQSHFSYNELGWVDQVAIALPGKLSTGANAQPDPRVRTLFGFDTNNGNCQFDHDISSHDVPLKILNMGGAKSDVVVVISRTRSETLLEYSVQLNVVNLQSGKQMWTTSIPADRTEYEIVPGPDVNQDGFKEIYLFSEHRSEKNRQKRGTKVAYAYVDVLSGKDGTVIASKVHRLDEPTFYARFKFAGLFGIGPDALPMLAVTYGASVANRPWDSRRFWQTHLVKASDGELLHTLTTQGPNPPMLLDLDENGLGDILIETTSTNGSVSGSHVIRGTTAEMDRGFFVSSNLWNATSIREGKRRVTTDNDEYTYDSIDKTYEEFLSNHRLDGVFAFPFSTSDDDYRQSPNGTAVKLDGDEDSNLETFIWENETLISKSEKTQTLRWKWAAPHGTGKVFGCMRNEEDHRILLASSGNQLFGIDYENGKPIWVCDGYFEDTERSLRNHIPAHDIPSPPDRRNLLLKKGSHSKFPRFGFVLFDRNSGREVTVFKSAMPLDATKLSTQSIPLPRTPVRFARTGDRPLPWIRLAMRINRFPVLLYVVFFTSIFGSYILFKRMVVMSRSAASENAQEPSKQVVNYEAFYFLTLFLPVATLSLFQGAAINGLITLLLMLFMTICVVLTQPRRKRTLFSWMLPLNLIAISVAIGVVWVWLDLRNVHYAARYDWSGWAGVLAIGLFVALILHYSVLSKGWRDKKSRVQDPSY